MSVSSPTTSTLIVDLFSPARMGTIMSIESAQARRGFAAHNYAPTMDTKTSKLVRVSLPMTPGEAPVRVLALMVNRSETSVRVVYSDHEHSVYFRTYMPTIPDLLSPEELDSLEIFLGKHERLCEDAALLGSMNHGPLTLARAVAHCVDTWATIEEGMAYANSISLDCCQYCLRVASAARGQAVHPAHS